MANWFYRIMGDEFGPFSTIELVDAVIANTVSGETEVRKETESFWTPAQHVKGLSEAVTKRRADLKREEAEQRQAQVDFEEKEKSRWENLKVSTCSPPAGRDYRVIDTIFAMDSSGEAGFLFNTEANPDDAFAKTKEQLRLRAFELGADAVVSCQFEYRVALSVNQTHEAIANLVGGANVGHSQCIEIFAYGTAVAYEK